MLVGHLHFHLHGARLWVECARRACDLTVEFLTGIFLENNFRCQSFVNRGRILLRGEHVNAKHITLHETEQRRAGVSGPSCHKRADIDIAGCDLTGKRREDLLETLNPFKLLQVRFRGFISFLVLIIFLFGYDFFLKQIAPAIGGDFGYLFLCARLRQLLIHLGG